MIMNLTLENISIVHLFLIKYNFFCIQKKKVIQFHYQFLQLVCILNLIQTKFNYWFFKSIKSDSFSQKQNKFLLSSPNNKIEMFSLPSCIVCYQCKKNPKQFTFLLCNHIICGQCISKNTFHTTKHNLIKCLCGSQTYFNQQNQIMNSEDISKFKKQKQFKMENNYYSKRLPKNNLEKFSFDQNTNYSSKQNINLDSKTFINQRSTMPMLEVSEVFSLNRSDSQENQQYQSKSPRIQKYMKGNSTINLFKNKNQTQKTVQQSLLLSNFQQTSSKRPQKVQAISQLGTHEIKTSSYAEYQQNLIKKIQQSKNKTVDQIKKNLLQKATTNSLQPQSKSKYLIHSRFQNQLQFLKILFKKDLQQIQFHFKKIMTQFEAEYKKLQDQLRSLYVEEVITKQSLSKLNLSTLVKNKYQNTIGLKFKKLKNHLLLYNEDQNKTQKVPQRLCLQTFGTGKFKKPLNDQSYQNMHPYFCQQNIYHNQNQMTQPTHKKPYYFPNKDMKIIYQNQCQPAQNKSMVSKFQTVEQRMDKFRNIEDLKRNTFSFQNQQDDHDDSSKRIHTQNIHTHIKRSKRQTDYHKERPIRCQSNDIRSQKHMRKTQKPSNRSFSRIRYDNDQQNLNSRKDMIYFSPPHAYCQKHLKQRSRQAKNYISYIEKLCHEKKMKNNRQLFKKVKTSHPYQFKYRE